MQKCKQAWKFIILILAGVLAVGACARNKVTPETEALNYTQEMREAVSLNIQDAGRRSQLIALIDRMDNLMKNYGIKIQIFVNRFDALNRNYDTTRKEMKNLVTEFADLRRQGQTRIIELNLQARKLCTQQEWDQIVRYEKEAVEAIAQPRSPQ
jgi:hypothetical protein